jgi:uncharacterized protein (DUF1778 family)
MNIHRPTRTEKLDVRLSPEAKRTLQLAAEAARKSVSEFVLESALDRAEESLPDRTRFTLSAAQWRDFMAALDRPPRRIERLERLFSEASPFELTRKP